MAIRPGVVVSLLLPARTGFDSGNCFGYAFLPPVALPCRSSLFVFTSAYQGYILMRDYTVVGHITVLFFRTLDDLVISVSGYV